MISRLVRRLRPRRSSHAVAIEHDKTLSLEQAERELQDLQQRANAAVQALDSRGGRNHWRESIERMIQGGAA